MVTPQYPQLRELELLASSRSSVRARSIPRRRERSPRATERVERAVARGRIVRRSTTSALLAAKEYLHRRLVKPRYRRP